MSSIYVNKILAGILVAALVGMATGKIAGGLVHSYTPEQLAYVPTVLSEGATQTISATAKAETGPEPIDALLASANVVAGEALMKKACGSCHNYARGAANKVGPNLWGVYDRATAGVAGFNYSKALTEHGGTWSVEELNGFLAKPRKWVPGTKMSYGGLKKAQDRANIVAFLQSLK